MNIHLASQRGAAAIILLMLLVVGVMTVLVKGLSPGRGRLRLNAATSLAMAKAKEAMISYAVTYADNYPPNGAGPGHLMGPDTNNDGQPESPVGMNALGRFPRFVALPSGSRFFLADQDSGIDQQFWYALTDAYRSNPAGVVNSSTPGSLTLDGQGDVVAVIMAPGPPLANQNRPSNNAGDYLEAGNRTGPAFVSSAAGNFNDRILAIRRSEMMPLVTVRVAEEIKKHLDAYHLANGAYPADAAAFASSLSSAPQWFTANQWLSVTTYTQLSANRASLRFSACNITYSLTFGVTGISRSQAQC